MLLVGCHDDQHGDEVGRRAVAAQIVAFSVTRLARTSRAVPPGESMTRIDPVAPLATAMGWSRKKGRLGAEKLLTEKMTVTSRCQLKLTDVVPIRIEPCGSSLPV